VSGILKHMSTPAISDDTAVSAVFEQLALEAGHVIMAIFGTGVAFQVKADASPVTEADRAAERIILDGLRRAFPKIPCVAEEEMAEGPCHAELGDTFFLVDPLDGTKEFVNRRSDFTVNIALVRKGIPEIGVVYAPAQGVLYAGRPGEASECQTVDSKAVRRRGICVGTRAQPPRIVASRSHRTRETEDFLAKFEGAQTVSVGSSLKFCHVASGRADFYPRFGPTMEWDTAAGDAILRAAGGTTKLLDGSPLLYGKRGRADQRDFVNPWFIADSGAAQ
jgi:3'(2'), 5'-bisphosphate nucleotidase